MSTREQLHREARVELADVVEDTYLTAKLLLQAGDISAANRIAALGDKLRDELLQLTSPRLAS